MADLDRARLHDIDRKLIARLDHEVRCRLLGIALGVASLSQSGKSFVGKISAGVVAGAVFPAVWFYGRFATTGTVGLVSMAILTLVLIGLLSITRSSNRGSTLLRRAGHIALGAVLILAPVLSGRAWANGDYVVNQHVRARIATNALAAYYADHELYPDSLDRLVEEGYLGEIPRPRVGFDFIYATGLLEPLEFLYRDLGQSYLIEFVSTEWVQCVYNPPFVIPEGEEDEYEEDEQGEVWSCPSSRPALWGDDVGRDEGDEYAEDEE